MSDAITTGRPLQEWFKERVLDREETDLKDVIYLKAGIRQVLWARDTLFYMLARHSSSNPDERLASEERYKWRKANPVLVVSEHTSKSMPLPVYRYNLDFLGLELTMRENFYGWVMSVRSDVPVKGPFYGLVEVVEGPDYLDFFPSYYAEGFREEWCFMPYFKGTCQFTNRFHSNENLWAFLYLLTEQVHEVVSS